MSMAVQRIAGVGLLVVISAALVLGVLKPNPLKDTYTYWAVFDTVHGLGAIDRDVRIAGVKLGEVGKVERVGDDVRVEMKLKEDYPVHTDARAAMRPHTLFEGSNFIDLEPGSPGAPRLKDGGGIPIRQTTNYVTLDKALRVLRPSIREDLRRLARVGSRTLRGEAITGLQTTLKNAPDLVRAVAPAARAAQGPNRRELIGSIRGLAATTEALADERDELLPLARRLNATVSALTTDGAAPLDAALAELPGTLQSVSANAPALETTVRRIGTFSDQLGTGAPRSLARALRATTPVLRSSAPILRDGTPVVRDARLIASRLAQARAGLVKTFETLNTPLDKFPGALAALNSKTKLGADSGAFQLVAGAFEGVNGAVSGFESYASNPAHSGHKLLTISMADERALAGLLPLLGGANPTNALTEKSVVSCDQVRKISPEAVSAVRSTGACK